jgi:hypothetical protein
MTSQAELVWPLCDEGTRIIRGNQAAVRRGLGFNWLVGWAVVQNQAESRVGDGHRQRFDQIHPHSSNPAGATNSLGFIR